MKDGYPHQLADTSQRDYEDLLASFRQVTEERNALRNDVERLHETLVGVRDDQTPRSCLYGV
jgi:predicted  nucleic acid-binding Zn-ribbon protein